MCHDVDFQNLNFYVYLLVVSTPEYFVLGMHPQWDAVCEWQESAAHG